MRIIAHLDMDSFFASVEERDKPYLKGLPIVVGADPKGGSGRGVVSTSSYAARSYGIFSATPIGQAWRLSEKAKKEGLQGVVFVTPRFSKYGEVSDKVMDIVKRHLKPFYVSLFEKEKPAFEQVSVDECYFDLSFAGTYAKATEIAGKIKRQIKIKEKLTCSVGIGPNKLIAKVASDFEKPNGLTVVKEEFVEEFLNPLPIRKIPGVGPVAEAKFKACGVTKIVQARKLGEEKIRSLLGKWGSDLYRKFTGQSDSVIITEKPPAKSVGEQETLSVDSLEFKELIPFVQKLAKQVAERVIEEGIDSFRTVVVTVRFADFTTVSRSRTFKSPISQGGMLARYATAMFCPFLDRRENPGRQKIRLVGIRVEKFM
ncbi:MAG: DNA polymerase IV [bacterium]|nr:DNA polymerase IV [bacterium]